MKRYTKSLTIVLFSMSLMPGFWGCAQNKANIEPQPQPNLSEDCRHPAEKQADVMVLNAELSDMTLSDVHFLPNRAILNSTGTQRLNHLAWIVEKYGGKIFLDVKKPKSKLTRQRIRTVKLYLTKWGLPRNKIRIAVGLPQTEGMRADEAIKIYDDTRYKSESKSSHK